MIPRAPMLYYLAVALSLSIGWGIRGNFGHETGAMIPGALAALMALILSGREDWLQRAGSFAFFGALGWSFGGSISYMQVIAYTHSGDSLSVLYGFGCLFLIGFLWAIFGGAGTGLPAFLDDAQLKSLYRLVFVVFAAWCLQDALVARLIHVDSDFRQRDPLYWYDTDWLGITVAIAATLLYAAAARKFDFGVRLALHLCAGWWAGFIFFVLLLGWRMTPPRGDNWAGCSGMAVALCIFLARERLMPLLYGSLLCGIWGGIGFAGAQLLKLLGIRTGLATNWHSLLEQTYGFINGIGVAAAILWLAKHAPPRRESAQPGVPRFDKVGIAFVLVAISYLNLQKSVEIWTKAGAVPSQLYELSARSWFALAYAFAAAAILVILFCRPKAGRSLLATEPLSRAQLFYLVFLWWMVTGNFERALVHFAPERLVTEGIILVNALLCTTLALITPAFQNTVLPGERRSFPRLLRTGTAALCLITVGSWAIIRMTFGDRQIGYASRHISFGPNATATKEKPAADKPHP